MVGLRYREGYVVIGPEVAGFVPTGKWRNLAGEIALGLVAVRVDLTRLGLNVLDPVTLPEELARLIREREGLFLDAEWAWTPGGPTSRKGAMLKRGSDTLVIKDTPPEAVMRRWQRIALEEDVQGQATLRRILLALAAVALLLAAGGVIGWRVSGNTDYLVAGLAFGGLIGGSTLAGVILGKRLAKQRRNT